MNKEQRIAELQTEFEKYAESHPDNNLNTIFREWVIGKLVDLEETMSWNAWSVWRG